jgi:hypothetical protein
MYGIILGTFGDQVIHNNMNRGGQVITKAGFTVHGLHDCGGIDRDRKISKC